MEPLTLLIWAALICGTAVTIALTALIIWSVIQTMRGKYPTTAKPSTTVIHNGTISAEPKAIAKAIQDAVKSGQFPHGGR